MRTLPRTSPPRGVSPTIARNVVVLPTPLRPSSTVTPVGATSNDTPWRMCSPAIRTDRSATDRTGSVI